MSVGLTPDQSLLRESANRFLSDAYDWQTRQHLLASGPGYDPDHWRRFIDLGFIAAPLPEACGGLGFSPVETAVMMEAIGRHLFVGPYFASVVLAGGVVAEATDSDRARTLLAPLLSGDGLITLAHLERTARFDLAHVSVRAEHEEDGWALSGEKTLVFWAEVSDTLIVSARTSGTVNDSDGISLFAVPRTAGGVTEKRYRTQDGDRASELAFHHVRLDQNALIGDAGAAYPAIEAAIDRATLALCAEAVGSMEALQETTLDYVRQREQFGRPIGEFQVIQHMLADAHVQRETAEAMTFAAAEHLAQGVSDDQRRRLVSAAKAQVGWSGRDVGKAAIQLHGGVGMTADIPVGHHFKRLNTIRTLFGDPAHHVARMRRLDDDIAVGA